MIGPPLFSAPSWESSQSLLCVPNSEDPAVHIFTDPPRGGRGGLTTTLLFSGSLLQEWLTKLHASAPLLPGEGAGSGSGFAPSWALAWRLIPQLCCVVHGLWQHQAERPLHGSPIATSFPAPVLGNSGGSGTPVLSVTPGILRPHCPT